MGKFSYIKADLKNHKIFSATKLIKLDILFLQDDQYINLHLKKVKQILNTQKLKLLLLL